MNAFASVDFWLFLVLCALAGEGTKSVMREKSPVGAAAALLVVAVIALHLGGVFFP